MEVIRQSRPRFIIAHQVIVVFPRPEGLAGPLPQRVGFAPGKSFPALQNFIKQVRAQRSDDDMHMIGHHHPRFEFTLWRAAREHKERIETGMNRYRLLRGFTWRVKCIPIVR